MKSLRILKEFDEKSQNHEISKYCKNIGMQKSTLEKMHIIPARHGFSMFFIALNLSISVCQREKYLIVFFYAKRP